MHCQLNDPRTPCKNVPTVTVKVAYSSTLNSCLTCLGEWVQGTVTLNYSSIVIKPIK